MDFEFVSFALIGVAFYAFIVWAVWTHVKEMRRQSEALGRIADLLERQQSPE